MMNGMAQTEFYDEQDRKEYEAEQARIAESKKRDRLNAIVQSLQAKADEQVQKKTHIEERWLEDMRQFHGRYDAETESKLNANNSSKSKLFFNITRMKTNGWEARLTDMLFPTDDRNWGIKPTPVPEIEMPKGQIPEAAYPAAPQGAAESAKIAMDSAVAEAKKKAEAMEQEIDDQFREADYYAKCRDMIGSACRIGTGVIKAPVVSSKNIRRWAKADEGEGPEGGSYVLAYMDDPSPDAHYVDPWSFFPDMSASSVDDAEFFFERHLKNKKQMRDLAKIAGFDKDAIRELLEEGTQDSSPDFVANLREITGVGEFSKADNNKFQVWEYHGPLEPEDIEIVCSCMGKEELLEDIGNDILEEIHVVAWFCQGKLIKFGLHLLDSQEPIYSVFCLEKDERCIFGFGIPSLMRDSQKSLSAAWRMILDNAGLSTGPQVVIDNSSIKPADGNWTLAPRKVWLKNSSSTPINQVFGTFSIESHQPELANIVQMSRQFADEETALPLVAQGESGSHQTTTAQGMSMLMNSVNVVFRRVIKNYDDDVTVRTVRRFYDWNMQFNDREDIKGDYNVDARGSSVLLVREMQAQNLLGMMNMFGAHPVFGPMTKHADLYRKAVQAHSIAADEIVMTDQEIAAMQQQQAEAEANGGTDPAQEMEIAKLNTQLEIANIDRMTKIEAAQINRDIQIMKLASDQQTTIEKIKAQLASEQIKADSKERIFAAEVGVSKQIGAGGGGYV